MKLLNVPLRWFVALLVLCSGQLMANGLVISNVQRTGVNRDNIQFNISWQNSWFVGGTPGNHDAVWVFIKFKPCEVPQSQYSHALLSTTMADHSFSTGVAAAKNVVVTNRYGTGTGHNTGILIRRRTTGVGNVVNETVTLHVVGATDGASMDPTLDYDVQVFGIEMVQIPPGGFSFGDNSIGNTNWFNTRYAVSIGTENTTVSVTYRWDRTVTVPAAFPKGVDEFYIMKYEISQGQYADFLNNIGSMGSQRASTAAGTNRYTIAVGANGYTPTEPNRACNFLSIEDVLAYLDWSALRPMTEMEYEKASKGGAFQEGGYAWGTNTFVEALRVQTPENGTERVTLNTDANLHCLGTAAAILNEAGVSQGSGPIGVGIFARDGNENRVSAGASFYGVMEMSGNVSEMVVAAGEYISTSTINSPSYQGIWGDGMLAGFGLADVAEWPAASRAAYGWRGGSWNDSNEYCRVGTRYWTTPYNESAPSATARDARMGGRGVR
jgi:formylglycine-generating enzyme required for sulfatase activity